MGSLLRQGTDLEGIQVNNAFDVLLQQVTSTRHIQMVEQSFSLVFQGNSNLLPHTFDLDLVLHQLDEKFLEQVHGLKG